MLGNNIKFTKKDLLKKVDSYNIFNYYFGSFVIRSKVYPSIFRNDKNPSTGFFTGDNGEIIYRDFSNGKTWDCISFVAELYNINYGEAINKISIDFGLKKGKGDEYKKAPKIITYKPEVKEEKIFTVTTKGYTKEALQFWEKYHITKEELKSNNIYHVNKFFVNNYETPNPNNTLRFAYLFKENDINYFKIYSPKDTVFKWVSNVPLKLCYGTETLLYKSNTLVISKSLKDSIILRKYFSDVIGLQNESAAAWNEEQLKPIIEKYKKILVWFDGDGPGQKALEFYKEKGFRTFHFPEWYNTDWGVKDPSDYVEKFGLKDFEIYLKQNNFING